MGKRGPQPQATAMKQLRGNPGRKPMNEREPDCVPVNEMPPPPAHFKEDEVEVWNRVGNVLIGMNVLAVGELEMFQRYCVMSAKWLRFKVFLEENGDGVYIQYEPGTRRIKYVGQVPQVAEFKDLSKQLLTYEQHFGLTPSSRSTVQTLRGVGSDHDPVAQFLGLVHGGKK